MAKRLALLVSTNQYQDKYLARLQTPEANVHALAAVLADQVIGNFSQTEILINEPADLLRQQIHELFYGRKRYDLLLLYLAGHGIINESGQLYLATADTSFDSLEETALPAAYITGCMDRSFSRQQVLILDCDYGQIVAPGDESIIDSRANTAPIFAGTGYRRVVLAANDTIQYAFTNGTVTGDSVSSTFTYHLTQGLRTGAADLDADEQIGVGELYDYVHDKVMGQNIYYRPRKWSYQADARFILARNSRSVPEPAIKWDLIFGAIMAPLTTLVIGWPADRSASVGMAGMFLLLYAVLYWILD